ncbi:MAG: sugar ABC transporter ATP-binding protein [Tissierellaceae bacterium]|nr:sugar ABC transporter ATP-binding protein [Tissierellaceae bacterium]
MDAAILSLVEVNKKISDIFELNDINIDFYPGKVCAVIGENGSGKSSLMNVISGLLPLDSGKMILDNEVINLNSINDGKNKGIYYVQQEANLFENLTIAENVFIDSLSYSYSPFKTVDFNEIFNLTKNLFRKLNVELDPLAYVKNMNLSQRQILSFVKAYVANAKITIFDEPSSALTDIENDILFRIIDLLKENGSSIIIISHKIDRILSIGDYVAILRNGSIIEKGNLKDYSNERIIQVISRSSSIDSFPKLHFEKEKEILSVNNINYKNSLNNISFTLQKQEILGIIGHSNSGKQQLIQVLFGMTKPESGTIFLDGTSINVTHPYDAMEKGFALVPEDKIEYSIFGKLDLTNNLTMSSLRRFSKNYVLDKYITTNVAKNYIDKLNINPGNPEDNIVHYSGGNQQKVAFAKSIMHFAKIYILDEPTRGMDLASKNDVYNIMNNLLINESSIIIFSSDFDEILGMCDRILVLSEGEIIAELDANHTNREELVYYLTL